MCVCVCGQIAQNVRVSLDNLCAYGKLRAFLNARPHERAERMTPPATASATTQTATAGPTAPVPAGIPARSDRLSLAEAAKHYDVRYETIRRWINIGVDGIKLESIRVGGRVFVTLAAIQAFDAALNQHNERVEQAARGHVDKKTQKAVSDGLKALGVIQ